MLAPEVHAWLGKAHALVSETGATADAAAIALAVPDLTHRMPPARSRAQEVILGAVYRALAKAELSAPVAATGSFIPAGSAFDAHAAFTKMLGTAKNEVFLIDPYMDDKALTEYAILANEAVVVRLLSDEKKHKPSLVPAFMKFRQQYQSTRPVEARLALPASLHDRLIILDQQQVWILTQSTNAFATRAPASIVRVEDETAELKIKAYEAIWSAAKNVP